MKTVVKTITGNWDLGFTLDKHMLSSTPLGEDQYGHMKFDNKRSEVGEGVYQLKCKGDITQASLGNIQQARAYRRGEILVYSIASR
jgi:hypothetical protein